MTTDAELQAQRDAVLAASVQTPPATDQSATIALLQAELAALKASIEPPPPPPPVSEPAGFQAALVALKDRLVGAGRAAGDDAHTVLGDLIDLLHRTSGGE